MFSLIRPEIPSFMIRIFLISFLFLLILLKSTFAQLSEIPSYKFHTKQSANYYHGIRSIVKDSIGRIWYSGRDGIFMYDGNNSYAKGRDLEKVSNKSSITVYQLHVTAKGQLFVATNSGLFLYNYRDANFKIVTTGPIRSITGDSDNIWILRDYQIDRFSISKGLVLRSFKFPNLNRERIREYIMPSLNKIGDVVYVTRENEVLFLSDKDYKLQKFVSLPARDLLQVISDGKKLYVLSEKQGVYVVDMKGNIERHIVYGISTSAKQIYIDKNNILWVATQSGLYLSNLSTGKFTWKRFSPDLPYGIPHSSVWSIYSDPDGGVWIGTFGGKLAYTSLGHSIINYVSPSPFGLSSPIISCFNEDNKGNIWIGTEGGGITLWNKADDTYRHYVDNSASDNLGSNLVKALVFDSSNKLNVALYNGGLRIFDPIKQVFLDSELNYPQNYSKKINVYDLEFEGDSGIWVADSDISETLYYKDNKTNTVSYIPLRYKNGASINDRINCLYKMSNGDLLLFGTEGLYQLDVRDKKIRRKYTSLDQTPGSNYLTCFNTVRDGIVWIGTKNNGILLFNGEKDLVPLRPNIGTVPKTIFSINYDAVTHTVWFTSPEGLHYYNYDENSVSKYDNFDQKRIGSFYPRAMFRSSGGEMFIGGTNGFIYFSPQKALTQTLPKDIFFTRFLVNNQPLNELERESPLKYDISCFRIEDKPIKLNYKLSNISIEFSSSDYSEESQSRRYFYRLLGGSNNWVPLDIDQRAVQFYNLPTGDYTVEIGVADGNANVYTALSSIGFSVLPPPWASPWAKAGYLLLVLGIALFVWKYFMDKKMFEQKLEVERIKEIELLKINNLRTAFFTRITHDLKTPLTLILNPVRELKEAVGSEGPYTYYIDLIENNAKKIQRKISQLLKLRQFESDSMELNPKVGDLQGHIERLFQPFEHYAGKQDIKTSLEYPHGNLPLIIYDHEIIEQICSNLFSNAVKYTAKEEKILVELSLQPKSLDAGLENQEATFVLKVTNSGVNMTAEEQKLIFNAFSGIGLTKPLFEERSGLGLSIVKELVKRSSGTILADFEGDLLSFIVSIPVKLARTEGVHTKASTMDEDAHKVERKTKKHTVVLIEDNKVLNKYVCLELEKKYNIYGAFDAKSGLSLVKKVDATLVITDNILPDLNGFEISKILKSDIQTSHIPIIMLSGMEGGDEARLEGLTSGVDIFMGKPFQVKHLIQQVENLIQGREKLKELYSQRYVVDPRKISISSVDDELMERIVMAIDENMHDPDFDVETLVSIIGISRTLLYHKVNNFTGMGIKELIMDLRLKRSIQLLDSSLYTVSEIAYSSGFNDPKYFSVCFKKNFGVSPSEYKKRQKK